MPGGTLSFASAPRIAPRANGVSNFSARFSPLPFVRHQPEHTDRQARQSTGPQASAGFNDHRDLLHDPRPLSRLPSEMSCRRSAPTNIRFGPGPPRLADGPLSHKSLAGRWENPDIQALPLFWACISAGVNIRVMYPDTRRTLTAPEVA